MMLNRDKLKTIVYTLGKFLGIFGLLFVLYKLSKEYTLSSFIEQFSLILPILPILLLVNIISFLIGIYAWHIMLVQYAGKSFPYIVSYYYYAKTEIAKYLPGNIFHLISRQILASKLGISQTQMAKISFFFFFLLITGTIISSTVFALLSNDIPQYILIVMGLISMTLFTVLIFLYPSFPLSKKIIMNILLAISVSLQGIMLGMIILYQNDAMSINVFFECISIYIISWLIGFITPGASGGLGVREGTFITIASFLHLNISSEIIIFSVLLIRVINIFIDIILYLSTFIWENKIKELKI